MTHPQAFALIAITAAVTFLTRALAFIVFPAGKKTPEFLQYLGKVLPGAIVGMLVIYCLKDADPTSRTHAVPEIAATAFIALIHKWRHNLLLSIVGGTALYMLLLRLM